MPRNTARATLTPARGSVIKETKRANRKECVIVLCPAILRTMWEKMKILPMKLLESSISGNREEAAATAKKTGSLVKIRERQI